MLRAALALLAFVGLVCVQDGTTLFQPAHGDPRLLAPRVSQLWRPALPAPASGARGDSFNSPRTARAASARAWVGDSAVLAVGGALAVGALCVRFSERNL